MTHFKEKTASNKKRFLFFMAGLVTATALTLMAFEWRVYNPELKKLSTEPVNEFAEQDPIPVTVKQPTSPPPPPAATPKPVPDEPEVKVDERDLTKNEPGEDFNFDDFPDGADEGEVEEDVPGSPRGIEKMPEFPGGDIEMTKFLSSKIRYPEYAKDRGIEGKVYLEFTVTKKGEIEDVELLRGIGGGCDEEAERILKAMPLWKPGVQNGVKVSVRHRIAILFKLH